MAAPLLLGVSILVILAGLPAHFIILSKLSDAGVEIKCFAHVQDTLRAYSAYSRLAKEHGWSLWPVYACYSAYAALLGAVASLALRPSMLETIFRWTTK
jgi:hypothetical protein